MISVQVIPALNDNYIHLAAANHRAVVVDPGEAAPALSALRQSGAVLDAILLTHRHGDHTGGVAEIAKHYPAAKIYAPENCGVAGAEIVREGDVVSPPAGMELEVIATPGHTLEHVAYFGGGVLFAGDTLFACGCGRVFEGTMAAMQTSVAKLAALPPETKVYCGHEYTAANIDFALAVDAENAELQERKRQTAALRAEGLPTVPFTIADEAATNPFVRLREPAILAAAEKQAGRKPQTDAETFAILRRWKDGF